MGVAEQLLLPGHTSQSSQQNAAGVRGQAFRRQQRQAEPEQLVEETQWPTLLRACPTRSGGPQGPGHPAKGGCYTRTGNNLGNHARPSLLPDT